jgi:hypothetical protein
MVDVAAKVKKREVFGLRSPSTDPEQEIPLSRSKAFIQYCFAMQVKILGQNVAAK